MQCCSSHEITVSHPIRDHYPMQRKGHNVPSIHDPQLSEIQEHLPFHSLLSSSLPPPSVFTSMRKVSVTDFDDVEIVSYNDDADCYKICSCCWVRILPVFSASEHE